jgi:hypothetical protein
MRLYTVLSCFLQTAPRVSDDTFWVPTPPCQRTVANTVRSVPDVVITVWMCSWWWMRLSSETCKAVCRKYNRTVYSFILLDNYWQWFTTHRPMNIKKKSELCQLFHNFVLGLSISCSDDLMGTPPIVPHGEFQQALLQYFSFQTLSDILVQILRSHSLLLCKGKVIPAWMNTMSWRHMEEWRHIFMP